mmetsp:Transcript_115684/g.327117  ORF Transcript_115684/g.327117 Transcript_115684/m.327117 type:complete len:458 (-) Transcript_115684:112-1485(-)
MAPVAELLRRHGVASFSPQADRQMGFSGATVCDAQCVFADGSEALCFLKRIAPPPPAAAATPAALAKGERDFRSFVNECRFQAGCTDQLASCGCPAPKVFIVEAEAEEAGGGGAIPPPGFSSDAVVASWKAGRPVQFTLLTESLSADFEQHAVVPRELVTPLLGWLGRFHAAFWPSSSSSASGLARSGGLWEAGTHMMLGKRPAGELDPLPDIMSTFAAAFEGEEEGGFRGSRHFGSADQGRELGRRLLAVAPLVAHRLAPGNPTGGCGNGLMINGDNAWKTTLVHGDLKTANIFFRRLGSSAANAVQFIDWQWTGPGLAATDIIYLMLTSMDSYVLASAEEGDEELQRLEEAEITAILKTYHEAFLEAAVTCGAEGLQLPSFDDLQQDFRLATLDYARWIFCYRLKGETPANIRKRAAAPVVDINLAVCRRSLPHLGWLVRRVAAYLPLAEELQEG